MAVKCIFKSTKKSPQQIPIKSYHTVTNVMYLRSTITLTLNVLVTEFPAGSVKVYVTGVVPGGKELPGCLLVVGKTVPELSVTTGVSQGTFALVVPNGTVTVTSSGKLKITGSIVSAIRVEY